MSGNISGRFLSEKHGAKSGECGESGQIRPLFQAQTRESEPRCDTVHCGDEEETR